MYEPKRYEREDLQTALRVLRQGGIILYPTDTIWGIGCDATNEEAVQRIYRLKQRADSKSMLMLLDGAGKLQSYVNEIPDTASMLLDATGSIGIRITSEPFTRALCEQLHHPIVSTSANISGQPAAKTFREIADEIKQGVDYVCRFRQDDETPHKPSAIIKVNKDNTFEVIR